MPSIKTTDGLDADLAPLASLGKYVREVPSALLEGGDIRQLRKLELSVAAEFGSLAADEAAFLYEIDLTTLGADGKKAVHAALEGDLSGLADAGALPAGIREVRSILSRARASRFRVKVNLLGIFNFASVSQLPLNGTVTFMPRRANS